MGDITHSYVRAWPTESEMVENLVCQWITQGILLRKFHFKDKLSIDTNFLKSIHYWNSTYFLPINWSWDIVFLPEAVLVTNERLSVSFFSNALFTNPLWSFQLGQQNVDNPPHNFSWYLSFLGTKVNVKTTLK